MRASRPNMEMRGELHPRSLTPIPLVFLFTMRNASLPGLGIMAGCGGNTILCPLQPSKLEFGNHGKLFLHRQDV